MNTATDTQPNNKGTPQIDLDGTGSGQRQIPARWPRQPQWRNSYPTPEVTDYLSELVRDNSIETVYYRGLADEQIIMAVLRGNPDAQIVVWDYWGYWISVNDGGDNETPQDPPPPPWGSAQVKFQFEGSPHLSPDLFIVDKDLGAKALCLETQARVVVLAGLSRQGLDVDRYSWSERGTISSGYRKSPRQLK